MSAPALAAAGTRGSAGACSRRRHQRRGGDHGGEGGAAGEALERPEPIGSPKTTTPPRIAAQLEATEAVAITGIASPSCIPRASAKKAPSAADHGDHASTG